MTISRSLVLSIVLAIASIAAPTTSSAAQEIFFRATPHALGGAGQEEEPEPGPPPAPTYCQRFPSAVTLAPGSYSSTADFETVAGSYDSDEFDAIELWDDRCNRRVMVNMHPGNFNDPAGARMLASSLNEFVPGFFDAEFLSDDNNALHFETRDTVTINSTFVQRLGMRRQ